MCSPGTQPRRGSSQEQRRQGVLDAPQGCRDKILRIVEPWRFVPAIVREFWRP
jgi:hypothetical protein